MNVIRVNDVPKEPLNMPLFTGGPMRRQVILSEKTGKQFSLNIVHFSVGARTKFHTHTTDQILIVTEGQGIVGTDKEKQVVTVGDVILFPSGEKHLHGATKDSAFSHMAITALGGKTTTLED